MIVMLARWMSGLIGTFILVLDKRWELVIVVLYPFKDAGKVVLVSWLE